MSKHRVLIVDDYPDAAEIACTLLGHLGHECRAASCAREALEEASRFDPDIALLDLGLPDVSGYDLARELRELAHGRPLYLAAISGWPEDRERTRKAGFDQYVLKPADSYKLRDVLARAERLFFGSVTSASRG